MELHLSSQTQGELAVVARQVADMPHDEFSHADLVGATLDLVPGIAQMEVADAIERHGYAAVLAYAEHALARLQRQTGEEM